MSDQPTAQPVPEKSTLYPNRCATCGQPVITDGTLHTWSGRMGLPEKPYDHPAVPAQGGAR
ncbi:MAG: hypothetical protein ABW046_07065 [Actinoplanes sp.]